MDDNARKLTPGEIHILNLVERDKNEDGWTPVSAQIKHLFIPLVNDGLVDMQDTKDERGMAQVTEKGLSILAAARWL